VVAPNDPGRMTEAARLAEITTILARGAVRLLATQSNCVRAAKKFSNPLDDLADHEAPCRPAASRPDQTAIA
jgi:hypothetical protein